MMRDYTVRVNDTLVTRLPMSFHPYFNMAIVGDYLLLSTHIGQFLIMVYWYEFALVPKIIFCIWRGKHCMERQTTTSRSNRTRDLQAKNMWTVWKFQQLSTR